MKLVAAAGKILVGELVESSEAVGGIPAGSRGGVVELLDDEIVLVELIDAPPEPVLDRLVEVPKDHLRPVSAPPRP